MASSMPSLSTVNPQVLERYLRKLFRLGDRDNNGVLDHKEFSNLLGKSGLGFSKRLIRRLLLDADVNQDGVIEYDEYVPVMLEVIQSKIRKNVKAEEEAQANEAATAHILNGMSVEQLERQITKFFMRADTDNNGTLDRSEFIQCLRDLDFGLTKNEILTLFVDVDVNHDGRISYDEFVPFAVKLLIEIVKEQFIEEAGNANAQTFFLDLFSRYDDGSGRLALSQMRDALSSVGLNAVQVQAVLSEAPTDAGGLVPIRGFARVAAQMLADFFPSDETDAAAIVEREEEPFTESAEELERYLRQLFYGADVEANGYLHPRAFGQLLRSSNLGLSNKTIRRVIEQADVDGNGMIDYLEYVTAMVQIIQEQQAKRQFKKRAWEEEARARNQAQEFLLQGVSRDWLERSILKMFMSADVNNNGTLDPAEFNACMRQLDLGMTNNEITYLMSEIDVNKDGAISYQEFAPLMFDVLVEMFKDNFLDDYSTLRLQEYFVDIFKEYDHKGSGKVSVSQLREALSLSSLGLSAVQVQAVVSEARQDEGGFVKYTPFSRVAALMISDMLGDEVTAARETQSTGMLQYVSTSEPVQTSLNPEVEAMVSRYEGDHEAVKARSLASTPGLRGKLSDLAAQLARVQDENDAIRQRYLELEDSWTAMGDENQALRRRVTTLEEELSEKTSSLQTATTLNTQLEEKLGSTRADYLEQRALADEATENYRNADDALGKKTQEADLLRRESMSQETELRKLRDAWNQREAKLAQLEDQRGFYEEQLSQLGESYQAMVDKLSYVTTDQSVRTTPLQVRVGGGYELLSNYLNRVFDEQDHIAAKYRNDARAPVSPYMPQRFPLQVTPTR